MIFQTCDPWCRQPGPDLNASSVPTPGDTVPLRGGATKDHEHSGSSEHGTWPVVGATPQEPLRILLISASGPSPGCSGSERGPEPGLPWTKVLQQQAPGLRCSPLCLARAAGNTADVAEATEDFPEEKIQCVSQPGSGRENLRRSCLQRGLLYRRVWDAGGAPGEGEEAEGVAVVTRGPRGQRERAMTGCRRGAWRGDRLRGTVTLDGGTCSTR